MSKVTEFITSVMEKGGKKTIPLTDRVCCRLPALHGYYLDEMTEAVGMSKSGFAEVVLRNALEDAWQAYLNGLDEQSRFETKVELHDWLQSPELDESSRDYAALKAEQ